MGNCITAESSSLPIINRLFRPPTGDNARHSSPNHHNLSLANNQNSTPNRYFPKILGGSGGDVSSASVSGSINNVSSRHHVSHHPTNISKSGDINNKCNQLVNCGNKPGHQNSNNHNLSINNLTNGIDQQKRIMICLFDFSTKKEGDLSVRRGDRLLVTDIHDPDWFLAEHLASKRSGFVPRNFIASEPIEMEDWFFPRTNRRDAEKLLLTGNNCRGTFLVRNSEQAQTGYSLSIRDEDSQNNVHVKHYKIKTLDNGGYFVATRMTFKTMTDLIAYYSKAPNGLCCKLVRACPKSKPKFWPDRSDELQRSEITFIRKIGSGCFGEVYYGSYKNTTEVAIKTLKQGTMSAQAFLEEAIIMRKCRHKNLVPLFGVCSKDEPLLIITEYMCNGSLLDYLRNNPEGKSLTPLDLLDMASQIACGMEYLEQVKLIHRDLAARNILVGENRVVKVADFGLARVIEDSEYTARQGAKFPIKWTAPEAAMYGKFSIKSDVWSYGILLYELVTYGQVPYAHMTNKEVIEQIQRGYRLVKPADCPDEVYKCMRDCWHSDPDKRPTFEYLANFFENYNISSEQSYRDPSESF